MVDRLRIDQVVVDPVNQQPRLTTRPEILTATRKPPASPGYSREASRPVADRAEPTLQRLRD